MKKGKNITGMKIEDVEESIIIESDVKGICLKVCNLARNVKVTNQTQENVAKKKIHGQNDRADNVAEVLS